MSVQPFQNPLGDIRQRIGKLEADFNKKRSRNFQLGYPISMTLLVGSIALWIIFTGAVMMSSIGRLAGFLMGCLVLSIMIVCFRLVYKRWDQKSVQHVQQTAKNMFNDEFPAGESEARKLAMDFLQENFDTYSLAQVLLTRQNQTDVSAVETSSPLQA